VRETDSMLLPGSSRQRLARRLSTAHADGLLSDETLALRLELLFDNRVVDADLLVGDLTQRTATRGLRALADKLRPRRAEPPVLLALDWQGGQGELLVGRHRSCDLVLSHPAVSRLHARLAFRSGTWVLQDLDSTNGTTVNGAPVGRCRLAPGDLVVFGEQPVRID
jgi:FHA domain